MIGVLVCLLAMLSAGYGWLVIASYVYCRLSGHQDLFVFPWTQWLEIAPAWRTTFWTEADVMLAALVPTALFGMLALAWIKRRMKAVTPALYGKTGWATWRELARSGLQRRRSVR